MSETSKRPSEPSQTGKTRKPYTFKSEATKAARSEKSSEMWRGRWADSQIHVVQKEAMQRGRQVKIAEQEELARPHYERFGVPVELAHDHFWKGRQTFQCLKREQPELASQVIRDNGLDLLHRKHITVIVGYLLLDGRLPHIYDTSKGRCRFFWQREQ